MSYEEFMEIYEKSELRMEYTNNEIVLLASPEGQDHPYQAGPVRILTSIKNLITLK